MPCYPAAPDPLSRRQIAALGALFVLAVVVRVIGVGGGLWLDEINSAVEGVPRTAAIAGHGFSRRLPPPAVLGGRRLACLPC